MLISVCEYRPAYGTDLRASAISLHCWRTAQTFRTILRRVSKGRVQILEFRTAGEPTSQTSRMPNKKLIRLSKSCLSAAEKQAVMGVLDREYLGMGADVQQFENALEAFFGRPVAC